MPLTQNVVATYIGVALYIVLYSGYSLYDKFILKSPHHFVPVLEVDLDTDAVWKTGEGQMIRENEREEIRQKEEKEGAAHGVRHWLRKAWNHVEYI